MPEMPTEKSKMIEYLIDRLGQELRRVCMWYVQGQTPPLGCQIVIAVNGKVGVDLDPDLIPSHEYSGEGPYRFKYIYFSSSSGSPFDDADLGCDCPEEIDWRGCKDVEHTGECNENHADDWSSYYQDLYSENEGDLYEEIEEWLPENCTARSLAHLIATNSEPQVLSL